MKELISFFSLYLQEEYWLGSSLWLMLLLLYGNTIFYLIDFYNLVRRKSKAETAAMLAIPGTVSVSLFLIAVVYVLLWAVCFSLQRRRKKKDVTRWMLSCGPDACFVLMISISFIYRAAAGASLFWSVPEWVLWLYLYAVYFLCCKVLLFALYLVVQLYSIRLTIFRWREGISPSVFLFCYYVFLKII